MVRENVLMFALVCGQVLWSSNVHDEIHEVLKEPPPADFALFNSEKSGGGLVLILTNLTAGYNISHAS